MLSDGLLPLLLAGGLLVSCTQEELPQDGGTPLPDGEYPLRLSAFVETATRVTADDVWNGGEQVAVQAATLPDAGASADWSAAEVATYKVIDAEGRMDADTPIYWRKADEKKVLRAWYCGDGSSAAGRENASAVPEEWTVRSDQSGIVTLPGGGEADGYQASDLLFTPEVTAAFAGDAAVSLQFCHQTAKVVVNIRKAEAVTDASQIKAVRVGDGDLALTAGFVAPTGGATAGTWSPAAADGTVTPRRLTAPAQTEYVATYEALLIPQTVSGKRMVAVETAAGTMYYTAPDDAAPFVPGKVRTYNITVKVDRLEVETVSSGTWSAGGEENVTSKEVKQSFTADELKIGDYFYSDGTTSDGGLRKLYFDGSMEIASPKPAPVLTNPGTGAARKVVGIVFQTDKSRIGAKEKEKLGGEGKVHGLVMAVKNAATDQQQWGPYGQDEGLTKCNTKADNYNDISGYGNCEHIRTNRGNFDNYPAFKATYDYNTTYPVSATTTGWYFPSSGQWWDILQNLGGCPVFAKQDEQTSSQSGDFTWTGQGDVPAALNAWMEKIATDSKDDFNSGDCFFSSSEYSDYRARVWYVSSRGSVYCEWTNKSSDFDVRPVLAF